MTKRSLRVWDLPTRVFHWTLALCVLGLFVTGKVGGNAMVWHLRLGLLMLTLLCFRLLWGMIGPRWSRFAQFIRGPVAVWDYLQGRSPAEQLIGHSPLAGWAVVTMLGVLTAQTVTGLMSDDEIAFFGPLVSQVSGDTVALATWWHTEWGQYLVLGIVGVHLLAIAYYALIRRQTIVQPMLGGDQVVAHGTKGDPARDDFGLRLLGAAILALCAAGTWGLVSWATP
jgi:cytochrome b